MMMQDQPLNEISANFEVLSSDNRFTLQTGLVIAGLRDSGIKAEDKIQDPSISARFARQSAALQPVVGAPQAPAFRPAAPGMANR